MSLTSICCKVLEHIIHHHVISHFDEQGVPTDAQHGFRKRRSCETQLILTIQDLAKGLDDNGQTDAVLLDFSKAFDKVPHQRLRLKLHHYGVRGETLDWLGAFLSGRSRRVVCGGSVSSFCPVVSGVPQGTVLGPLLFLVYINDLPSVVSSTTRLFADDSLLYRRITTQVDVESLQNDLDQLQKWEDKWEMCFNPDKCKVLRLTLKQKPIISQYSIHGQPLETVSSAKYLGLTIDSKLTFKAHINTIAKKSNAIRAFVARTTKSCPHQVKVDAYKTYVRPILEYSSAVWDPHTQNNIQQLEAVQRRAARSVMRDYKRTSSVTAMLKPLGWATLQERRTRARVTMMYKIVHGHVDIPQHPHLVPNLRSTRGNIMKFLVPKTRIAAYHHSFFPSTIRLWNTLTSVVVQAQSVSTFQAGLA